MALQSLAAVMPRAFARPRPLTFADAVREHQDELFGVALRILGDRDAAQDATSRALLKAFRAWDRYDPSRPVRHWLLRIVANEAISIGRERTRDRERSASADAALDTFRRASHRRARRADAERAAGPPRRARRICPHQRHGSRGVDSAAWRGAVLPRWCRRDRARRRCRPRNDRDLRRGGRVTARC